MSNELLPCPFCGGEAKVRRSEFGYKAFCDKPFCCWMGTFRAEQEAIAAWNTRAERTCKIEGTYDDEFGIYDHLTCGHVAMRQWPEPTKFCPHCGAKVVD